MTDAIFEPDLLTGREPEPSGAASRLPRVPLAEGLDEADAVDLLREAGDDPLAGLSLEGAGGTGPYLRGEVSEADAIDQAIPAGFDDEDDWRG